MLLELQAVGIKAGLALLPKSQPQDYVEEISHADHILLFGGELGHQGGTADLTVLGKVGDIRAINPTVELGWDGGITAENTPTLVEAGIEVLNVGGFIQHADDPKQAYESISKTFKTDQA
jgi:ribulose-phosphate 3-epimerase